MTSTSNNARESILLMITFNCLFGFSSVCFSESEWYEVYGSPEQLFQVMQFKGIINHHRFYDVNSTVSTFICIKLWGVFVNIVTRLCCCFICDQSYKSWINLTKSIFYGKISISCIHSSPAIISTRLLWSLKRFKQNMP